MSAMFLIIFILSILETRADQPVIQYDTAEHAHFNAPHMNKLRLEKHLVILPKVSHRVEYLSNPFRREADTQDVKPVSEPSLEPPTPTAPVAAAFHATPTPDIFANLNLNYEVPSYSTPADFQESVNALTHQMINKQVKFPGTSYGVPVTDTPEQVKHSTVNALVNMLIGLDKQKKQGDMLSQIVQFMQKKKMQQEQQALITQLQQQMQKEQYKPFIQSQDQAEGLFNFMQQLLEPLKQQSLASLPLDNTARPTAPSAQGGLSIATPGSVISHSLPNAEFDWTPSKPFVEHNVPKAAATTSSFAVASGYPTVVPSVMTYQTQFQPAPSIPTKPTFTVVKDYPSHTFSSPSVPSLQSAPSVPSVSFGSSGSSGKEGYVIRLSKPTIIKEQLPASTSMPKVVQQHMQPIMPETLPRNPHQEDFHFKSKPHSGHTQTEHHIAHIKDSSSSSSDIFAPKFEHYIMKHHGEKSKPQLIKLNEDHHHHHASHEKFHSKHKPFDVTKIEQEFSNGVGQHHHHHHSSKRRPQRQNHQVLEALKFEDSAEGYDFTSTKNEYEHEMHIHEPFTTFNNHEFDQEFLKNFDNMAFKEENVPGYEEPKKTRKPLPKAPQKFIILKKTKRS